MNFFYTKKEEEKFSNYEKNSIKKFGVIKLKGLNELQNIVEEVPSCFSSYQKKRFEAD